MWGNRILRAVRLASGNNEMADWVEWVGKGGYRQNLIGVDGDFDVSQLSISRENFDGKVEH